MGIDKLKLKAIKSQADSGAHIDPKSALYLLAEIDRFESQALCPACKGSGEYWVMSSDGPDAFRIKLRCGECDGQGTLECAHKTAKFRLHESHDRYIELVEKITLGDIERDRLANQVGALQQELRELRERNILLVQESECVKAGQSGDK